MHDKTLILPIIEDLTNLVRKKSNIEIIVGNFTNLGKEMIIQFLNDQNNDLFDFKTLNNIKFTTEFGTVQCFDCDFLGTPTNIIQDHALHSNVMVMCPECDSIQTTKIGGNKIKVKEI